MRGVLSLSLGLWCSPRGEIQKGGLRQGFRKGGGKIQNGGGGGILLL